MSVRFAVSSRGAVGAHRCQAAMTAVAHSNGHLTRKQAVAGSATVSKTSSVTMPKPPAPPPRSAQNRSTWARSSQQTTRPSASTTCAARRRSHASPYRWPSRSQPATQREPGDAHRAAAACRDRHPVDGELVVEGAERGPGAHPHRAIADGDGRHRGDVDDEAIARRAAGEAVPAAADGDWHTSITGERSAAATSSGRRQRTTASGRTAW